MHSICTPQRLVLNLDHDAFLRRSIEDRKGTTHSIRELEGNWFHTLNIPSTLGYFPKGCAVMPVLRPIAPRY
jgi:hypothetical protein